MNGAPFFPGPPRQVRVRYVAFLTLMLAGCSGGVLDPQGAVGHGERIILLNSLVIMLVIVVPTILVTLGFAWWFRASNTKATYLPDWTYSGRVETIVWAIPTLVVMFLGGIAWIGSHDLDPYAPITPSDKLPLEVEVISLDWKWLFIYPGQGVASLNELTVPVGTPIHFRLTSATVMNSFFVPQLGSQIYTMAGMNSQLNLIADQPGVYRGISAQFSGDGFSDMHFEVHAVSEADFGSWLDKTKSSDLALDRAAYGKLLQPGVEPQPRTYGKVDTGIFDRITMESMGMESHAPSQHGEPPHEQNPHPPPNQTTTKEHS